MSYEIRIGGLDRTADVISNTLVIDDEVNDKVNTCTFRLLDESELGIPEDGDEIIITLDDATRVFGGYISTVSLSKSEYGKVCADIQCVDYTLDLNRVLAHISYESQTDQAIIQDLVSQYASVYGITTTNVLSSATIDQIVFNYIQLSQAIKKIANLANMNFYVDYYKDIHYFPLTQNPAPFDITDVSTNYEKLRIRKDPSQIKNRIYVRGGTSLSDFVVFTEKGDGEKRVFLLPEKAHDVTVEVNGTPQTVGIKNIDTSGYDFYLNFQEKYLEQDSGGSVLGTGDTLEVTYKYDIPILIAQEDTTSIAERGVYEFPIFDRSLTTIESARARAIAELTDYANNRVDGSFETWDTGFRSGQYMNINQSEYDVNDDYLVQSVTMRSIGGGVFRYRVTVANAKDLGIIRFLINLLENNRNIIELDPNETVDELFTISDTVSSPTESVGDTVVTPPYKWSNDAGTTPTKMVWGLFEWS